jgi:acetyl-CoA carboxylase carboxyl transferase subunit alpha
LGIGIGDRVLMLEHAIYSVISPEGYVGVMKGDSSKVALTADILKPTSQDLYQLGVIDEIIDEPFGGAHRDWETALENVSKAAGRQLGEVMRIAPDDRKEQRYAKFRAMGIFEETR